MVVGGWEWWALKAHRESQRACEPARHQTIPRQTSNRLFPKTSTVHRSQMRAVIQRVKEATVTVTEEVVGRIGPGLVVLVGVEPTDTPEDLEWLAQRVARLRLFPNADGPWELSVAEADREVLVVSQFTLFASTKKGTKPSWHRAAKPDVAEKACADFVAALSQLIPTPAQTGRFGAMMEVALVNDGPVTILLDSKVRE
jgi:D-aminoacyl-tRNA deacylase